MCFAVEFSDNHLVNKSQTITMRRKMIKSDEKMSQRMPTKMIEEKTRVMMITRNIKKSKERRKLSSKWNSVRNMAILPEAKASSNKLIKTRPPSKL